MKLKNAVCLMGAMFFTIAAAFTSFAEVIENISLEVSSNIQAGSAESDVEVKSLSDSCSVVRTDVRNAPESVWNAGDTPKLYVLIECNDGYSFPTSGASLDSDALVVSLSGCNGTVTKKELSGFSRIYVNIKLEALGGGAGDSSVSTGAAQDNAQREAAIEEKAVANSDTQNTSDAAVTYTLIKASAGANRQESAAELFDNDSGSKWCTKSTDPYVIFMTSVPVAVTGYHFVTGNDNSTYKGRNPSSWTLYGCNSDTEPDKDSSLWQVIDSVESDTTMEDVNYTEYYFPLSGTAPAYQYYMLKAESTVSTLQLSELALSYAGSSFTFKKGSSSSSTSSSSSGGGTVSGLLCATCHGSGRRSNGQICFACGGSGYVP